MTSIQSAMHADHWPDDQDLRRLIISYIQDDPTFWTGLAYAGAVIVVEVHDGIVTLNGFVRSASQRRKVDALVRTLGALGVDNRLRVDGEVASRAT